MRLRTELGYILIGLGEFQQFDHGKPIEQLLSEEWDLEPGDVLNWECAQFDGQAEVIERKGQSCIIKKLW